MANEHPSRRYGFIEEILEIRRATEYRWGMLVCQLIAVPLPRTIGGLAWPRGNVVKLGVDRRFGFLPAIHLLVASLQRTVMDPSPSSTSSMTRHR